MGALIRKAHARVGRKIRGPPGVPHIHLLGERTLIWRAPLLFALAFAPALATVCPRDHDRIG